MRGAKTIRVINLRAFSCCEVLQKLGNFAKFASLGFPPFFWCLLKLLLMLLLEDGCLLHASTPCSRSLHLRQQQLCPRASLLEKLELPLEAMPGSAQRLNGAGKILAGEQQVPASLLRAISASEAPRQNHVRFSGYNSAKLMMVAPANDGDP